jgi:sugar lactone lactonase YvrE
MVKISAEGKKLESIPMPRGRITSGCFGGANLDRLYVTAAFGDDEGKISPCLYELKGEGLRGRAEFLSALQPGIKMRLYARTRPATWQKSS